MKKNLMPLKLQQKSLGHIYSLSKYVRLLWPLTTNKLSGLPCTIPPTQLGKESAFISKIYM